MKTLKAEVKALPGDTVFVKELESKTIVTSVCVTAQNTTYEIAWFHNGERKSAWVHPHEFEVSR